MFIPFLWMVFSAFKPLDEIFLRPPKLLPQAWTVDGFKTAWEGAPFASAFFNSFYISALVTIFTLLTCAMAAYAFARIRFPGNNVLFGIFLATMMVPFQLTIIPLYIILGELNWIDTHLALIVPASLFNAFGVFLLRQYVRGIPLELEEAAAIDGANRVRTFITVILPLLRTPMTALGIFVFLFQWNNFFQPLIFLNSEELFTIPLVVNYFKGAYSSDWTSLMAATTMAAMPMLIVFIIAQKQIVEGIALSGSKT
jgi:multiple sugar transport system permease protein